MKYSDSTNPATYQMLVPLFTDQTLTRELERAGLVRFHVIGLYHSIVDADWSSQDREEADFFHYIHLACGGRARIRHQGQPFELEAGQAYWLTGNTPVVREPAQRYESYVLKFRCEGRGGADPLLDWPGRGPRRLGTWDRERWISLWSNTPPTANACLVLEGMLRLWMAEAYPDMDKILANHYETFARFDRALSCLEERLGADLRVTELARAHGTTLHAFSMAFERHIGMSPKAYLNRRLNQEASRLLLNTDWRVKEVAQKLAFADEFYFSRFFTKMNGVSPGRFRRQFGVSKEAEAKS